MKTSQQLPNLVKLIIESLGDLTHREIDIINLRYNSRKTQGEVGKMFNLTRERVRQLENRAIASICDKINDNQPTNTPD